MTLIIRYLGVLSLIFLTAACIDPYNPDVGPYEDALAITGSVLEGRRITRIQLGSTFGFEEEKPRLLGNAKVIINDDEGLSYQLEEKEIGIYETDTSDFVGMVGRSYQLRVETPNGNIYESDWQLMKKSAQIDNLYFEQSLDVRGFDSLDGVQVLVDASDPENTTRFYRWEFEETWHVQVPMPSRADWNTDNHTYTLYENDEIPHICYASQKSNDITLRNTLGLSEDRLVRVPINFVSGESNRLVRRYSILVKQYSLTEESYNFWKIAKDLTQDVGTLFDPIPNQLVGNFRNINDPTEPVLGYFSADGYDEKRIFIDRLDLPPDFSILSNYDFCEEVFFELNQAEDLSLYILNQGGSLSGFATDNFGFVVGFFGAAPECTDCRLQGQLEKPDFWE
ncbi:MAG: DUF4249 domain-containing protein [Bacteroidia bacterium]|nr:DUF4249 domain-containing protein [Bacteroidia bacterium]